MQLRRRLIPILSAVLLTPVLYILSYAPVYRLAHGPDPSPLRWLPRESQPWERCYAPVIWLIDADRFCRIHDRWGDVCGVQGQLQFDWLRRSVERYGVWPMIDPP